ncbi:MULTISPECIES: hypothetical protein [unclassified Pseudomonas]|uniref:hypothetical protein n=1 Tax=unclassified Pseudomonas TaxID=196821 RepID=UPI001593FC17|nr:MULTISPECIES: hypothetical protein [unclassified Pseudomonas]
MSKHNRINVLWSASVLTSVFSGRSKTLIKAAGYGVMSMFVSCGVGAQDFTASTDNAKAITECVQPRTAPSWSLTQYDDQSRSTLLDPVHSKP